MQVRDFITEYVNADKTKLDVNSPVVVQIEGGITLYPLERAYVRNGSIVLVMGLTEVDSLNCEAP